MSFRFYIHSLFYSSIMIWCIHSITIPAHAQDQGQEELSAEELLDLASMLVRDGHYDRALRTIFSIDAADEDLDLGKYHATSGLAYFYLQMPDKAKTSFLAAIAAGNPSGALYAYLAKISYDEQDYASTLDSISKSSDRSASLAMMQATSLWRLSQYEKAFDSFHVGLANYPADVGLRLQLMEYYLDLGLIQHASATAEQVLTSDLFKERDALIIAQAYAGKDRFQDLAPLMEQALLRQPNSLDIHLALAKTYHRLDKSFVAAGLFEQASYFAEEHIATAAELYRLGGQLGKALTLNGQISDQKVKLQQRLAIYLDQEDFEKALAMKSALERHDLLDKDEVKYALAYAQFKAGRFEAAMKGLALLESSDQMEKANHMRKMILSCTSGDSPCVF